MLILADSVMAAILNFKMDVNQICVFYHISDSYLSLCKPHMDFVLVSRPRFSGSRNPLRALLIILADFIMAAILNFKMAANFISVLSYLGLQST